MGKPILISTSDFVLWQSQKKNLVDATANVHVTEVPNCTAHLAEDDGVVLFTLVVIADIADGLFHVELLRLGTKKTKPSFNTNIEKLGNGIK